MKRKTIAQAVLEDVDSVEQELRSTLDVPGGSHALASAAPLRSVVQPPYDRTLLGTIGLVVGIVAWALINLARGWVGFAMIVPIGFRGGGEVAISLGRLFAALVLVLIVADRLSARLRWVACGFLVLGLGQFIFGYLEPILASTFDLNRALYEMIFVRTLAGALFVVGLTPRTAPRFSWRAAAAVLGASLVCVGGYWALASVHAVPTLVRIDSLEAAARLRIAPMTWMTGWHWAFATVPLVLTAIATVGAVKLARSGEIGSWLPFAVTLQAGSELHDALWPSAYGNSALMNSADLLRLSMAAVAVIGGTLELRRISRERSRLLEAEQERARRLAELATLKADLTAVVAHELGYPLSAIRRQTEMLARGGLDSPLREQTLDTIIRETTAMDALVADVQATADAEREGFGVNLQPVPVHDLIQDAIAIAETHSQDHQLETVVDGTMVNARVLADRQRIGQVLRNLLCNAAKYAPAGSLVSLRAEHLDGRRVRFAVEDRGTGIHPDDLTRIFEKFGRGRSSQERGVPGAGIGLYFSQRILRAHGTDLTVNSSLGVGSVFAFELEVAQPRPNGRRP